jgi:hypothetical protein
MEVDVVVLLEVLVDDVLVELVEDEVELVDELVEEVLELDELVELELVV